MQQQQHYDYTKVFLGSVHHHLNRPQIEDYLLGRGFNPTAVYVIDKKQQGTALQCCFVQFENQEQARWLLELDGESDPRITPTKLVALIIVTQHGSLLIF